MFYPGAHELPAHLVYRAAYHRRALLRPKVEVNAFRVDQPFDPSDHTASLGVPVGGTDPQVRQHGGRRDLMLNAPPFRDHVRGAPRPGVCRKLHQHHKVKVAVHTRSSASTRSDHHDALNPPEPNRRNLRGESLGNQ
jgi:hypothetical protein